MFQKLNYVVMFAMSQVNKIFFLKNLQQNVFLNKYISRNVLIKTRHKNYIANKESLGYNKGVSTLTSFH